MEVLSTYLAPIYLSVYYQLSAYHTSIYLSVCLSSIIDLSIMYYSPIIYRIGIYVSSRLSSIMPLSCIYLAVAVIIILIIIHLFLHPSIGLSILQSPIIFRLSVCLCVHTSAHLSASPRPAYRLFTLPLLTQHHGLRPSLAYLRLPRRAESQLCPHSVPAPAPSPETHARTGLGVADPDLG